MPDELPDRELERCFTSGEIRQRVERLGEQISRDFEGEPLLLVGVLKGAAVFLADLARAIRLDCTFDFISVSSYGTDGRSLGTVRLIKDLEDPISNRNVLLVEDICDTGVTLVSLRNLLLARGPATLKIVALLDKPSRRLEPIEADYVGFTIPDRFVVGYGMDIAERYRNLPDIYFLTRSIELNSSPKKPGKLRASASTPADINQQPKT